MEIKILSNILKADEIYDLLKDDLENREDIVFENKKEPEDSKSLDPSIVVALIQAGGIAVTLLINTIITVWATKREDKTATIKIKYADSETQNNLEVEFPVGLPQNKLDEYIDKIKNKVVKRVIIHESK